ncbi:MAG: hypothetical protein K2H95_09675 [Bacteroidales bacterium]|nr:hypothetical protein [Bacteroidales bacterium]
MRRLMMILCIIWLAVPCTGQKAKRLLAGIDAAKAVRGIAGIHFGYGFAGHWSAEAGISVDFMQMKSAVPDEKGIHDSEFTEEDTAINREPDYCKESLSIRYWPYGVFQKTSIGIGLDFGAKGNADMILSAGYTFCVWKGIRLTASYGVSLRGCMTKKQPDASGISLCISYNF